MYENTELIFCNVENIHVMRASANTWAEALAVQQNLHASSKEVLVGDLSSSAGYFSRLEEAGWLRHIQYLLLAATLAAEKLHFEDASVLVHCSDGWYLPPTLPFPSLSLPSELCTGTAPRRSAVSRRCCSIPSTALWKDWPRSSRRTGAPSGTSSKVP